MGSANPDKLASPNAKNGWSGLAAMQGMAMAMPSGMLWRAMLKVTIDAKDEVDDVAGFCGVADGSEDGDDSTIVDVTDG